MVHTPIRLALALAVGLTASWAAVARAQTVPPPPPQYGPQAQQPHAPPARQPYAPPATRDPARGWRSGDPVPPGYEIDTRANWVLVGIGGGMVGASWISSALIGWTVGQECDDPDAYRLFVPVLGPWLTIPETGGSAEPVLDLMLVFDGVFQTVGATLLVIGLLSKRERIVPARNPAAAVQPYVGLGTGGLVGTF